MKLPKLSAAELRALHAPVIDGRSEQAERIKAHLSAGLPANARIEVRMRPAASRPCEGGTPCVEVDNELLAAWVAARFGATGAQQPVPAHYRQGMLKRVRQALAELVLRGQLEGMPSLCLDIVLNGRDGLLDIGWDGISPGQLKAWAVKQWAVR